MSEHTHTQIVPVKKSGEIYDPVRNMARNLLDIPQDKFPVRPRRETYLDHFTPAQARAIGEIVAEWMKVRMDGIAQNEIGELRDKLDYLIAVYGLKQPKHADIVLWKARQQQKPTPATVRPIEP